MEIIDLGNDLRIDDLETGFHLIGLHDGNAIADEGPMSTPEEVATALERHLGEDEEGDSWIHIDSWRMVLMMPASAAGRFSEALAFLSSGGIR